VGLPRLLPIGVPQMRIWQRAEPERRCIRTVVPGQQPVEASWLFARATQCGAIGDRSAGALRADVGGT
jgi:hypothetical protein